MRVKFNRVLFTTEEKKLLKKWDKVMGEEEKEKKWRYNKAREHFEACTKKQESAEPTEDFLSSVRPPTASTSSSGAESEGGEPRGEGPRVEEVSSTDEDLESDDWAEEESERATSQESTGSFPATEPSLLQEEEVEPLRKLTPCDELLKHYVF